MFDLTVSEHSYFIDWAKFELSRDSAVIGDLNRKYLREFGTVYGNTLVGESVAYKEMKKLGVENFVRLSYWKKMIKSEKTTENFKYYTIRTLNNFTLNIKTDRSDKFFRQFTYVWAFTTKLKWPWYKPSLGLRKGWDKAFQSMFFDIYLNTEILAIIPVPYSHRGGRI